MLIRNSLDRQPEYYMCHLYLKPISPGYDHISLLNNEHIKLQPMVMFTNNTDLYDMDQHIVITSYVSKVEIKMQGIFVEAYKYIFLHLDNNTISLLDLISTQSTKEQQLNDKLSLSFNSYNNVVLNILDSDYILIYELEELPYNEVNKWKKQNS